MIVLSPNAASTLSPVTGGHAWVMFVQIAPPIGAGPIKIEGIAGELIAQRLTAIADDNGYPTFIIGLLPVEDHDLAAKSLHEQFAIAHLHGTWFEPTIELLSFIQETSQAALQQLMGGVDTTDEPEGAVDIEGIAQVLGVSTRTIKRLVADRQIPHYKVGRQLRFIVSEVREALARR
jgi:excisionase family DNA binding protein